MAEFLDDGHTGTDFERPGFRALMAALQEKAYHIPLPLLTFPAWDVTTWKWAFCRKRLFLL